MSLGGFAPSLSLRDQVRSQVIFRKKLSLVQGRLDSRALSIRPF